MDKIFISILGISEPIPSEKYDNTFLAIQAYSYSALFDCAGSPLLKMQKAGISPYELDAVIITHRHPDHLYGLPFLLQGLGLLGREKNLKIFAPQDVLVLISSLINLIELNDLINDFLELEKIPQVFAHKIIDGQDLTISTSPVNHSVPTIAVKINNNKSGRSAVYSSDTGPLEQLIEFAKCTDILINESYASNSNKSTEHSNGKQVGKLAKQARAKKLVLIHLPVYTNKIELIAKEAIMEFGGNVEIPEELSTYTI